MAAFPEHRFPQARAHRRYVLLYACGNRCPGKAAIDHHPSAIEFAPSPLPFHILLALGAVVKSASGDVSRQSNSSAQLAMLKSRLFRCKSLDQLVGETADPSQQLRRVLGPVQLTLLGVGAIIGAGIFSTVGTAAAGGGEHIGAGPALVLSFVFVAIACGFAALCYSEFASMVPVSGSAYTYAYATLGELVAWIIGWDLILEYAVGNVAVAISWSDYFQSLLAGFKLVWPVWLGTDYRSALQAVHKIAEAKAGGIDLSTLGDVRSEERRVGKACRSRWAP